MFESIENMGDTVRGIEMKARGPLCRAVFWAFFVQDSSNFDHFRALPSENSFIFGVSMTESHCNRKLTFTGTAFLLDELVY